MARIKLSPRRKYPFRTHLQVRISDLNYGGHLGNDRLLALVHEARVDYLASYGFSEKDCGGTALIIGDTAVVYQAEAFAGDRLRFEVAAGEPSRCGFRLFYRITRPADGRAIALVENGMVAYDYSRGAPRTLPEGARILFGPERSQQ